MDEYADGSMRRAEHWGALRRCGSSIEDNGKENGMRFEQSTENGFSLIEVAIASVITMGGLVFLASLFTLAISQNRMIKQYTTAVALAQEKLEELNAIETGDKRLDLGGGLTEALKKTDYYDTLYVNPLTGELTSVTPTGPASAFALYDRYWLVEPDADLTNAVLISVRVKARQPSVGKTAEETTLATERSW